MSNTLQQVRRVTSRNQFGKGNVTVSNEGFSRAIRVDQTVKFRDDDRSKRTGMETAGERLVQELRKWLPIGFICELHTFANLKLQIS